MPEGLLEGAGAVSNAAANAGFAEAASAAENAAAALLQGNTESLPAEFLFYVVERVLSLMRENAAPVLTLAAVCIFSAFVSRLSAQNGLLSKDATGMGFSFVAALPAVGIFSAVFFVARGAMGRMEAIALAVIPVAAVLGTGTSSVWFLTAAQSVSALMRFVFLPFAAVYGAVAYSGAAVGENFLTGLQKLMKTVFTWGLGLVMTVFSFCSAMSGLAAGASLSLSGRTIKYAGGLIPVVGPYLSEAADTVLAGASLIRTAGGVCAAAAVLSVALPPLLELFAYFFAVCIVSAVCGAFADARTKGMIAVTAEVAGMIVGLTALMCAFFIINIAVIASVRAS